MEKTYNGRPLRAGVIPNFAGMTQGELMNVKRDLGLAMPIGMLTRFQKKLVSPAGRITTDELYMADVYADTCIALSGAVSFPEIRTSSEDIKEALSDLMSKRRAIGSQMPITLSSLTEVYSRYLKCAGYDSDDARPAVYYDIKEKHPSGDIRFHTRHMYDSAYGCGDTNYVIAKTDTRYRFNTDKERITPAFYSEPYHLLLVRLDEKPFAYEELANVIHSNARLSKDIIYCAPIGKAGLINALLGTSHGYTINMDIVSALIGEELRPYDLSLPMNAALLLVPAQVSQGIAMAILDFGYRVRFAGHTNDAEGSFSVLYQGIYHTLNTRSVKDILPSFAPLLTLNDTPTGKAFVKTVTPREGLSVTAFSGLTFTEAYTALKDAIDKVDPSFPQRRIYAYLAMPVAGLAVPSGEAVALGELLGIYKALSERAIPLVSYDFIPTVKEENAAIFLVCEEK